MQTMVDRVNDTFDPKAERMIAEFAAEFATAEFAYGTGREAGKS